MKDSMLTRVAERTIRSGVTAYFAYRSCAVPVSSIVQLAAILVCEHFAVLLIRQPQTIAGCLAGELTHAAVEAFRQCSGVEELLRWIKRALVHANSAAGVAETLDESATEQRAVPLALANSA